MEFRNAMEVEGVDFGRQLMLRAYHVKRASFNDVQCYLHSLGSTDGHRLITDDRIRNSPISIYLPTDNAQLAQKIWSMATIGIATPHAKAVLFYFDEPGLKSWALEHLPFKVALHDVKSLLIDPFHNNSSQLARCKIKKGKVTLYMYAVKQKSRNFNGERAFKQLITEIENLENINDPNIATQVLQILLPILNIGISAASV